MNLAIGESYDIEIEKIIYGGDGLGRVNSQAVFVPFAAPGDKLRIRITALERNFARGEILEILTPSIHRRPAPCKHFGVCGGCQLQHLNYSEQKNSKAEFIRESLRRIGGIDWQEEISVFSDEEFGYRARAEIKIYRRGAENAGKKQKEIPPALQSHFSSSTFSAVQIGFYKANSHDICEITNCPILLPAANVELQKLHQPPDLLPNHATRVYLTVGDDVTLATPATGENAREMEIDAKGTVTQKIAGITYRFGVRTFFQANRLLVEKLVAAAIQNARGKIAFDLYAGAGLFALQLAKNFDHVFAVEGSKISVPHGIKNAAANKIENVEYFAQSVETWLKFQAPKLPRPDFVLLDPPRAGAGATVINRLAALKVKQINYVSCDPTTLARDLKLLTSARYKIDSVTAFDMFPQTFHVETLVKLVKR